MARYLTGIVPSSSIAHTQVYHATHDGEGNRLPYMRRSFISFSYGGKFIEDFNLIIVNDDDKMSRSLYSEFEDSITDKITLDGQYFWGTHFKANDLQLTLATDGMTQNQLDEFKRWFKPGIERELILAEHPNRVTLARLAEPPQMNMLPFEHSTTYTVNNAVKNISTTLYKGNINIHFTMDEPTWRGKLTYMPSYVDKITLEDLSRSEVTSSTRVETIENDDMIKIMLEDGIPHQSILSQEMFLGGNCLVRAGALVAPDDNSDRTKYALTDHSHLDIISISSENGLSINSNTYAYLFYSGTGCSYPTIKFAIMPNFDNENFLTTPKNIVQNSSLTTYSQIIVQKGNDINTRKVFSFTTPSILTEYNQAIEIFKNCVQDSTVNVVEKIRDKIKEKYARAWAIACVNSLGENSSLDETDVNTLISYMNSFINANVPFVFTINSKTGEAIGSFSIKVLSGANVITGASYINVEENVGDMIRSDYLVLDEKNYLENDGTIDLSKCYCISSNEELTNVLFLYDNMYL